jgi:multiple sugar transport system substrate-binding protein
MSLVSLLAFALGACTPSATQTASTAPANTKTPRPAPTVEAASSLGVDEDALRGLTIEAWHPWFSGVEASLFESQVEMFNEENQWGIEVIYSGQTNYGYLYENVTASLPTPRRPDLVIALPEHARAWDADNYVVDLTPYIHDPFYGWSDEETGDFAAPFWVQDSAGTTQLGLPAQRTARLMVWNKTWADELGFDSPPETPEDFQQQVCRAHDSMLTDSTPDNDGLGGWLIDTDAMTALSWLLAFEGGVLEGNDYRFLTPKNIAAFAFVKSLQQEGCAWQVLPGRDPMEAFGSRGALFATAGLEQFADLARAFAAANNTDEWLPLAFPGEGEDALVVYGSSYVMLESSDEEQLASWLFIRWMLEPENDARWVKTTGLFPLRDSTRDLLADYEASHTQWADAVKLIPDAQIQPQLASWRTVRVMLGDGFDCLFRANQQCQQAAVVLRQMEATSRDLSD